MKRRVLGLVVLLSVAGIVAWLVLRPHPAPRPVTEAEARTHLAELVAAGQAHDFNRLCSLAGAVLNCRRLLDEAGPDAVPTQPPTIEQAAYHDAKTHDGTPGWVLVVSGTDGRGRHYQTDVLIFRDDTGRIVATNAVYWSGAHIVFDDPNGVSSPGS